MRHENYQSRANRDQRARELEKQGHTVRKSSIRNQNLHPQYVKDWEGEVRTGFGNDQYNTFFLVLYSVAYE